MTVPYAPTPFTTGPVINPAIGGYGAPVPYLSTSMYTFAPTALDTTNLVPGGGAGSNERALADVIRRASAMADRICFGVDPAPKDVSLCATQNVETVQTKMMGNELRLICDYKPVLELDGLSVGTNPSNVTPVQGSITTFVRFGRRTIYVPMQALFWNGTPQLFLPVFGSGIYAVWSYVNGYPHTYLTANVTQGGQTWTLNPTSASGGFYGVYPGTALTIYDGASTETLTVASVAANVVTSVSGAQFSHTAATLPDFLPVTAIPEDVHQAVIHLTSHLIKDRGDNAIVWDNSGLPARKPGQPNTPGENDLQQACCLLEPFRVVVKSKV